MLCNILSLSFMSILFVALYLYLSVLQEKGPIEAGWAKVVPTPNNGSTELVKIRKATVNTVLE